MKKIIKEETKVVKVETYVSADGKEFNDENDCLKWEKSYRGTLELSWKMLNPEKVYAPNFGLPYNNDDDNCFVVTPKNLEEVTLINAYIDCQTNENGNRITADTIGKAVLLNFGYDFDWCDTYILEEHLARLTETINKHINPEEPETKSE